MTIFIFVCDLCEVRSSPQQFPDTDIKPPPPDGWWTVHADDLHLCPTCWAHVDVKVRSLRDDLRTIHSHPHDCFQPDQWWRIVADWEGSR